MRPFAACALLLFSFFLFLPAAFAEVPDRPREAMRETDLAPAGGGGSGACTLIYYNHCSSWIWLYQNFAAGDRVGVVYDVADDCGSGSGQCHTGGFWYWRFTAPGYGRTLAYDLYAADCQSLCPVGPSVGSLTGVDPIERWNTIDPLGCAAGGCMAVVATFEAGVLPKLATDNNVMNETGGPDCAGSAPGNKSSVYFGNATTEYCPPLPFDDARGPVDILTRHGFLHFDTPTENASWSEVKGLFR